MSEKVAVIGGGAAGLISAIIAARRGKAVSILERMPRTGKKLLATGNGRCNVTNIEICLLYTSMGILLTRDAHGLYEKYGFTRDGETFMMKR